MKSDFIDIGGTVVVVTHEGVHITHNLYQWSYLPYLFIRIDNGLFCHLGVNGIIDNVDNVDNVDCKWEELSLPEHIKLYEAGAVVQVINLAHKAKKRMGVAE